jgi:hypothetical protein
MLEYAYETGLNTPILDWAHGMSTTFPFGVNTPDLHFTVPTGMFGTETVENSFVNGLKNPITD